MKCPKCIKKAKVTRTFAEENGTVREHYCPSCGHQFTTVAVVFESSLSGYKLAQKLKSGDLKIGTEQESVALEGNTDHKIAS